MLLKRLATRPVFRQKTLSLSLPRVFFLCLSPPKRSVNGSKTLSPSPLLPFQILLRCLPPPSSPLHRFVCLYECFFDSGVPGSWRAKSALCLHRAKGEHAVRATRPKIDAHITPDIGVFLSPLDPCLLRILCILPCPTFPTPPPSLPLHPLPKLSSLALYYDNVFIGPRTRARAPCRIRSRMRDTRLNIRAGGRRSLHSLQPRS